MAFDGPRALGATGLTVGPIGLSSGFVGQLKDAEELFALGCNYFVVGRNRKPAMMKAIRRLARKQREAVVVALETGAVGPLRLRLAVEIELMRLGLDHLDGVLLASPDPLRLEALLEAAVRLKEKGKIGFTGITLSKPADGATEAALGAHMDHVPVLHLPVNPVDRSLPISGGPLGQAAWVGHTATGRGRMIGTAKGNDNAPSVSDCYRYVLSQPRVTACLAGTPQPGEMRVAVQDLRKGSMTESELAWISRVGDAIRRIEQDRATKPGPQKRRKRSSSKSNRR